MLNSNYQAKLGFHNQLDMAASTMLFIIRHYFLKIMNVLKGSK